MALVVETGWMGEKKEEGKKKRKKRRYEKDLNVVRKKHKQDKGFDVQRHIKEPNSQERKD